jgi:hypothetical protein
MVRPGVASEDTGDLGPDPELNVDPEQVHLVVDALELDIIVDALRSVGNVELADRFEAIMRSLARPGSRGRET